MSESFEVVFALYPQITQLDFTGPFEVLSRLPGANCVLASIDGGEVAADRGLTFANVVPLSAVSRCDLLCVPGGYGTVAMLNEVRYLEQLRRLGRDAMYITSVCTGSLLLAAAGLLSGKQAACHWAWRDGLRAFNVVPDVARIVRDGNVITGGGVTAGIDMALTVMAEIAGDDYARTVQLALEYNPQPPFDCGHPSRAPLAIVAAARQRLDQLRDVREAAISAAAQRLFSSSANGR